MVTIHHLEVRLEVEGEGDEAVFTRYFNKYIQKWSRLMDEARARQRQAEEHRSLGGRAEQEGS
jgi:hypothetical protein